MKDINEIAFIIQSRKGSVRVKNKMLKPFNGSCLFEIALQKVLKSKIIPKENFYVSILDDEFKDIANKHKVNIFHRSQESTVEPVELPVVFGWHNKLPKPYKYWVTINGCNPLLSIDTIDRFVESFISTDSKGMFGVFEKKTFLFNNEGLMLNKFFGEDKYLATLETKYVETCYEAAHSLYAGTMEDIKNEIYTGTFKNLGDPEFFIMDEIECFDIDWPFQFEIAKTMYKQRKDLIWK
jgi:CMP-N-acetylneuraminic acid synthetase|tara:strand:+ start:8836 stop:9549 length:714 start_codon:yes stop_codon:yes gene_type:complete